MPPETPPSGPGRFAREFALAMEMPFVIVGSTMLGGFLGYLLDRWLGTRPFLMIILGGLGLYAGIRELLRRMPKGSNGGSGKGAGEP